MMTDKNTTGYVERQSIASDLSYLSDELDNDFHTFDIHRGLGGGDYTNHDPIDIGNIYELHECPPVDRSKIANLATLDDIRPGTILELCDVLGSRQQVTVVSPLYTATLEHDGRTHTCFNVVPCDWDVVECLSVVDKGIAPASDDDSFHQFHWTELVQAAE